MSQKPINEILIASDQGSGGTHEQSNPLLVGVVLSIFIGVLTFIGGLSVGISVRKQTSAVDEFLTRI